MESKPVADFLLARRRRAARALLERSVQCLGAHAEPAVVLIGAGERIAVPGQHDRTYPFMAHSAYFHLADQDCPGGVLALDLAEAEHEAPWRAFAPEVTQAHRTWEGEVVWEGAPLAELAAWLARRRGRPVAMLGCPVGGYGGGVDATLSAELDDALLHARRVLDDEALARMRSACQATAAGHAMAQELLTSGRAEGWSEWRLKVEIEAEFFRHGGDGTPYDTIVGSGANAAVLHASPSDEPIRAGRCVLVDAGASHRRYAADVTRTWPVGLASQAQREAIGVVIDAEQAAIDACKPGVEWHDVHRLASEKLMEGMASMGLVVGEPAELVERGVAALFFPHGVGHMIGLGVRGAGGRLPGRTPRLGPGGVAVRVDLPLEAGYAMTVEPGMYFIAGLIDGPSVRERFADAVRWSAVDALRQEIQGIRIEDDVLVVPDGCQVLTAQIPRQP